MRYFFDSYALDLDRRELLRGTETIAVEPKVFDLLEYLIRNRERVVSRDDLIGSVWGGRIVSELALSTRINAARSAIGDSGAEQRLIRTLPRKGIRFVGVVEEEHQTVTAAAAIETSKPALAFPDRASIAVLPFANLSGDPEQEYFADGMVDEIITSLTRVQWLVVTARTSTFAFKGQSIDIRDIARRLNVRYVLEGSVRKAANRLRIIGQLIDADTGIHIWADRIEGTLDDIFDLQDRITESVVGAIEPKLQHAEIERAKRKRPESMDAYDYYLRALPSSHRPTPNDSAEALRLLEKGFSIDQDYPPANALGAWLYFYRVAATWSTSPHEDRIRAIRLAHAAIDCGDGYPLVLALGGFLLASMGRDVAMGVSAINRAVEMSPNSATVLQHAGWTLTFTGDQDRALIHLKAAIRLSPSDPLTYRALRVCPGTSGRITKFSQHEAD